MILKFYHLSASKVRLGNFYISSPIIVSSYLFMTLKIELECLKIENYILSVKWEKVLRALEVSLAALVATRSS